MRRKTAIRGAILLLLAAGIGFAALSRPAFNPLAIRDAIAANPLSPVLFITLQVAASLLFVPRTILAVAAGLIFGLVWGAVWAMAGAMAGAAMGFAVVRWFGAGGILDAAPRWGALIEKAEEGGWRSVAVMRLAPVPHSVANTLLGMTRMSWPAYLTGSFMGMLPMTLAQVDIGASGRSLGMSGNQWMVGCLLLALGLAASILLSRLSSRWGSQDRRDRII